MSIQFNNPTNIRYFPMIPWQGQLGDDGKGFCHFDTMAHGLRAAAINLLNKQVKHGLDYIEDIIGDEKLGWAPAKDGNDVPNYVKNVCAWTHYRPDEMIDLRTPSGLVAVLSAICRQETGFQDDAAVSVAAHEALQLVGA